MTIQNCTYENLRLTQIINLNFVKENKIFIHRSSSQNNGALARLMVIHAQDTNQSTPSCKRIKMHLCFSQTSSKEQVRVFWQDWLISLIDILVTLRVLTLYIWVIWPDLYFIVYLLGENVLSKCKQSMYNVKVDSFFCELMATSLWFHPSL